MKTSRNCVGGKFSMLDVWESRVVARPKRIFLCLIADRYRGRKSWKYFHKPGFSQIWSDLVVRVTRSFSGPVLHLLEISPDALLASINLALCKLQNSFLTKTKVKYLQSLTARFGFRFVFWCCADHARNHKFQKWSFVKFLLFTARVILDSQRLRVRPRDLVWA